MIAKPLLIGFGRPLKKNLTKLIISPKILFKVFSINYKLAQRKKVGKPK
jgi:hypothetical protein